MQGKRTKIQPSHETKISNQTQCQSPLISCYHNHQHDEMTDNI